MGIGPVSSASGAAELFKILEKGQAASADLAKKLIRVAVGEKVTAAEAEGKGQNIDVTA